MRYVVTLHGTDQDRLNFLTNASLNYLRTTSLGSTLRNNSESLDWASFMLMTG